jgi:hypothetical protein
LGWGWVWVWFGWLVGWLCVQLGLLATLQQASLQFIGNTVGQDQPLMLINCVAYGKTQCQINMRDNNLNGGGGSLVGSFFGNITCMYAYHCRCTPQPVDPVAPIAPMLRVSCSNDLLIHKAIPVHGALIPWPNSSRHRQVQVPCTSQYGRVCWLIGDRGCWIASHHNQFVL